MELPRDLLKMIEEDERVLWSGRPEFKPFILKSMGVAIVPLLFIVFFSSFFLYFQIPLVLPALIFMVLWFGILGIMLLKSILYPPLLWRNLYYVITNKRILVRKGVIGIDYDILSLDYVRRAYIDRGLWDKIYNTGTIVIEAIGVTPVRFYSIPDPLEAHKRLLEALRESETRKI